MCVARWCRVALALALLLLAPSIAVAQVVTSFQDLALRINLNDQIRIEDGAGASTTGRLTRLTREDLTIHTDTGDRRFASDAVREVAVRGPALRKGALIGASVFAILGAVANCSHEGGNACALVGSVAGAPIGAGVGLSLGALIPRMTTVYRAGAPVSRPPEAIGPQSSLLEDLALRVNLDDRLRIEDRSGVPTTGRLARLTADEITLLTSTGEKRFTRETLRQVAVRHQPLAIAVLIGASAGAAAGGVAACKGPDREECPDAPILAGALGAGLGLGVGALIHRTTVVYPEAGTRVLVSPVLERSTRGVRISIRW